MFDFMFPDEAGVVLKHKVKESWTGATNDEQLWHFGRPFDAFEEFFRTLLFTEAWIPDVIVITSLTSYWHKSIEKLLNKIYAHLGRRHRRCVKVCLYGNYPRCEPAHAASQDADVAFTRTVDTTGCFPDFPIYMAECGRLPSFFGLDIEDRDVAEHLRECLALQARTQRERGSTRAAILTVAFFNEDVCSKQSKLADVVRFAETTPKRLFVEGICGLEPASLTRERLTQIKAAGFRSLFVEHARLPGGGLDVAKYEPLLEFLSNEEQSRRAGVSQNVSLQRRGVTGFVSMGLRDDDMDELVRSTLVLNSYFQAVVLKPFGYSPSIDDASEEERVRRWGDPHAMSPQAFPYVGWGSRLSAADYDNLVRWQSLLNKRVKGSTFDFMGSGNIPRIVRETLIAESWKRQPETR